MAKTDPLKLMVSSERTILVASICLPIADFRFCFQTILRSTLLVLMSAKRISSAAARRVYVSSIVANFEKFFVCSLVLRKAKRLKFPKKSTLQSRKYNFPKTILVFFSAGITTLSKPFSQQRIISRKCHRYRLGSRLRWPDLALRAILRVDLQLLAGVWQTDLPGIVYWHLWIFMSLYKQPWNYRFFNNRTIGFKLL